MAATLSRARRALGVLIAGVLATAVGAPAATAGAFTSSATSCSDQTLEQPFLRWVDPAQYVLAPVGGLEEATSAWRLGGGAKVVTGNEWFRVGQASDSHSLSLPPGSSATTRPMCVGLEHPTLRLFVRNTGSWLSPLKVEVLYEDLLGNVRALQVGTVLAGSSWSPTLPIPFLVNVTGSLLSANGTTAVAFRFTPQGSYGAWQIDDVYVDPFKSR